jgi:hypothetical protein
MDTEESLVSNSDEMFARLKRLFGNENVTREWDVAKNSKDAYTRELYCPRVDFAVGPFNIDANIDYNNTLIEEAYRKHGKLLELLKSRSDSEDKALKPNENPRCFLAIEVEDKSSRKHRLGSIVNASALGKIGIIVASNERVFESLVKIRKYLEFLEKVRKTRNAPENVLIITRENFLKSLREVSQYELSIN